MRALYWQEIELTEYSFNEEGEKVEYYKYSNKEIRSDNKLVDKIWFVQSLSEDRTCLVLLIEIIAGQRFPCEPDPLAVDMAGLPLVTNIRRFSKKVTQKEYETLYIPEAIEWINNLKPEV